MLCIELVLPAGAIPTVNGTPAGASTKGVAVRKAKSSSSRLVLSQTSTSEAAASAQLWITCNRAVCTCALSASTTKVARKGKRISEVICLRFFLNDGTNVYEFV